MKQLVKELCDFVILVFNSGLIWKEKKMTVMETFVLLNDLFNDMTWRGKREELYFLSLDYLL
jgi:hypothetical protein